MFEFLKKLFRRKKAEEPTQPAPTPVPEEKPAEPVKTETCVVEGREQKVCSKCGAPNDKFVHKCWLCKSDI